MDKKTKTKNRTKFRQQLWLSQNNRNYLKKIAYKTGKTMSVICDEILSQYQNELSKTNKTKVNKKTS